MRIFEWNTRRMFGVWCGCWMATFVVSLVSSAWVDASTPLRIVVQSRTVSQIPEEQWLGVARSLRHALRSQKNLIVPKQQEIEQSLFSQPFDHAAQTLASDNMKQMQSYLDRAKKLYQMEAIAIQQRSRYALKALDLANQKEPSLHVIFNQSKLILQRNQVLQDLYFYYGLCYLGLGENEKARTYIHKLIRLMPFFSPEKHGASAEYVSLHRSIKEDLDKHRYTLHLESTPVGATVHYNNHYVGITPLTLPNLMAGKHKIRLSKMRYLVWQRVANLDPKRLGNRQVIPVKIALQLDPKRPTVDGLPLYQKGAEHNDDILDRMDQIVSRTKADYLYILEPQLVTTQDKKKVYQLQIAIFRKGYRTLYYQSVTLGPSLDGVESPLQSYSKTIQQQVTTNFFKPPKPIKE